MVQQRLLDGDVPARRIALTLGLGLLLSAVNVFFRDIAQVLGMVFTGWFYLTPIVYTFMANVFKTSKIPVAVTVKPATVLG